MKPPPGGPKDEYGPVVVLVKPPSMSREIDPGEPIEIHFDELVDPVSIPGSVIFMPEVEFTTKVRGRRVFIIPSNPLADDQTYVLTLQRGIRDYQKNGLAGSQQYVFSTGSEIPIGRIEGHVLGAGPKLAVVVGLFVPSDTSAEWEFHQSVDLGSDGRFSFSYLDDNTYRVVAVVGGLIDFPEGINRRKYALPPNEGLEVRGDTSMVRMLLSPPLSQPQMQSLEWLTPTYLAISFDTPFGEVPILETLHPMQTNLTFGYVVLEPDSDSTVIDLGEGFTQLGEPYRIEPFVMPGPTVVDTLPPMVSARHKMVTLEGVTTPGSRLIALGRGRVVFNEPVRLPAGLVARVMGNDTLETSLVSDSPLSAVLEVPTPELYNRAEFLGVGIMDYEGNQLADSLAVVSLVFSRPQTTGEISGLIEGLEGTVVIEALDAETGQRIVHTVTDSIYYHLELIPPGFYQVFAHEQIGQVPLPYYSGGWQPYRPAAPFAYYPEEVEVRPRWEVGGVDINFNAVSDTTEVPAGRKE
ncbi:MAG: Ig-like domain-containing protein [Candidatus Neomarinimicrobiota bacterium]